MRPTRNTRFVVFFDSGQVAVHYYVWVVVYWRDLTKGLHKTTQGPTFGHDDDHPIPAAKIWQADFGRSRPDRTNAGVKGLTRCYAINLQPSFTKKPARYYHYRHNHQFHRFRPKYGMTLLSPLHHHVAFPLPMVKLNKVFWWFIWNANYIGHTSTKSELHVVTDIKLNANILHRLTRKRVFHFMDERFIVQSLPPRSENLVPL